MIDFHTAYDLPDLRRARRTLELHVETGAVTLVDEFEVAAPLALEEVVTTWSKVDIQGSTARISGERSVLARLAVQRS